MSPCVKLRLCSQHFSRTGSRVEEGGERGGGGGGGRERVSGGGVLAGEGPKSVGRVEGEAFFRQAWCPFLLRSADGRLPSGSQASKLLGAGLGRVHV